MNPNFVSSNAGRRENIDVVRDRSQFGIQPPTPDQLTLAATRPDGKLLFSDVMTPGHNPTQPTGSCRYIQGLQCINLVRRILALTPNISIFSSKIIAGQLHRYFKRAQLVLIAIVIEKFAYGKAYIVGSQYQSLLQRVTTLHLCNDVEAINHWNFYVQTFANYIYNWVIPSNHPAYDSTGMFTCNPKQWIHRNRTRVNPHTRQSGKRAGIPLWSTKHVERRLRDGELHSRDSNICRGHNLQVALICHELFKFRDAVHPACLGVPHFVDTDEDVSSMFANAHQEKWRSLEGDEIP